MMKSVALCTPSRTVICTVSHNIGCTFFFWQVSNPSFPSRKNRFVISKLFRDKVWDFVAMATCRTRHKLSRDSHRKRLSVRTMGWTFGSNCFTLCSQEALRWNPSVSSLSFFARVSGSDLRFVFSSGTNKTLSFTLFQQIKGKNCCSLLMWATVTPGSHLIVVLAFTKEKYWVWLRA